MHTFLFGAILTFCVERIVVCRASYTVIQQHRRRERPTLCSPMSTSPRRKAVWRAETYQAQNPRVSFLAIPHIADIQSDLPPGPAGADVEGSLTHIGYQSPVLFSFQQVSRGDIGAEDAACVHKACPLFPLLNLPKFHHWPFFTSLHHYASPFSWWIFGLSQRLRLFLLHV